MGKFKFVKEYEFRASAKMLYPYLSTVSGLAEWFVEKVDLDTNKNFVFNWQGETIVGRMVSHKVNTQVKFEFSPKIDGIKTEPNNYLEFRIVPDELAGTTFLKVIDFSEMDDEVELNEMWDQFISNLRTQVGG